MVVVSRERLAIENSYYILLLLIINTCAYVASETLITVIKIFRE
jgi:hypothetical protein